jgi:ABC-2 type transport system ATP-binding protein
MNNQPVIQTTALTKYYKETKALDNMTVNIGAETITGLVGRNGSGKTTLMKIAAGQLDYTSGEALTFGERPMNNLNVLPKLVYSYHNFPHDKFQYTGVIIKGFQSMFPNFDRPFAEKLMAFFELKPKMWYSSLSQGMASIFNFITALACRTPLTLLDEPALGMDIMVRRSAYEILLRDFMEHPRSFVVSSHLLSELEGTLSDLIFIEEGKLIVNGAIDDIRNSAYRVDGKPESLDAFCKGKKTIFRQSGDILSFAVIYAALTDEDKKEASQRGLTVSNVRVEDLFVYLTGKNKEGELACLWN